MLVKDYLRISFVFKVTTERLLPNEVVNRPHNTHPTSREYSSYKKGANRSFAHLCEPAARLVNGRQNALVPFIKITHSQQHFCLRIYQHEFFIERAPWPVHSRLVAR